MGNYATTGKPKEIGGGIYRGQMGSIIPTDANSNLNEAFKNLGHISENGLTNGFEEENETFKDWSGEVVLEEQTSAKETFKYELIDVLDVEVLKEMFGDENVEGTLETGITVKSNSKERVAHPYIIDMIHANGILERIVIPNGKVTTRGEVTYKANDLVKFAITITAYPDENGDRSKRYIAKKSA